MDRVRILSNKVLKDYKERFGVNFKDNKSSLEEISVITSKELKNEIAGYITKFIKHEKLSQKIREEKEQKFDNNTEEEIHTETPLKTE